MPEDQVTKELEKIRKVYARGAIREYWRENKRDYRARMKKIQRKYEIKVDKIQRKYRGEAIRQHTEHLKQKNQSPIAVDHGRCNFCGKMNVTMAVDRERVIHHYRANCCHPGSKKHYQIEYVRGYNARMGDLMEYGFSFNEARIESMRGQGYDKSIPSLDLKSPSPLEVCIKSRMDVHGESEDEALLWCENWLFSGPKSVLHNPLDTLPRPGKSNVPDVYGKTQKQKEDIAEEL